MIQPMNKYAFLVFHRDYESFLLRLRELGVVHITERHGTKDVAHLQHLLQEREHIKALLRQLRPFETAGQVVSEIPISDEQAGKLVCLATEEALQNCTLTGEELRSLQAEAEEASLWGAFSTASLERLESRGYTLSFYSLPIARFTEDFVAKHAVVEISEKAGRKYFVLLHTLGEHPRLDEAEEISRPARSISELTPLLEEAQEKLQQRRQALIEQTPTFIAQLEGYDRLLENSFTFGKARLQADRLADERLLFLEGFVPTEQVKTFEEALEAAGDYYTQVDFDLENEKIPIQLKNNSFTRCFEFITGLFSLPNYQEIDQTFLIAPFFMLFFGMCFGDAGYGLVLFGVSTFFRLRSKDADTSLLGLGQWLGAGAFVVGLLMGGIFGIELPWAHNKAYLFNQDNMMMISVVIGIIQVLLGKSVGAYKKGRQLGWKHSLSGYAWVLLLASLGLLYALPMGGIVLPEIVKYIIYGIVGISVLVAFLYNKPGKNPFVNLGSGIWTTYETASGLLGDSLSYIRLFAIGLTGGILGSVFNQLAMSCVPEAGSDASIVSHIVGWLMALLVLIFGHGINFGIAMIGAFVHPLRLTFVEYYKNSEFEGGGKPYTPFARK